MSRRIRKWTPHAVTNRGSDCVCYSCRINRQCWQEPSRFDALRRRVRAPAKPTKQTQVYAQYNKCKPRQSPRQRFAACQCTRRRRCRDKGEAAALSRACRASRNRARRIKDGGSHVKRAAHDARRAYVVTASLDKSTRLAPGSASRVDLSRWRRFVCAEQRVSRRFVCAEQRVSRRTIRRAGVSSSQQRRSRRCVAAASIRCGVVAAYQASLSPKSCGGKCSQEHPKPQNPQPSRDSSKLFCMRLLPSSVLKQPEMVSVSCNALLCNSWAKMFRDCGSVLLCSKPLHTVLSKTQSAHALLQVVAVICPQDCCEALLNLVMDRRATSPQRRKILLVAIQTAFLISCSLPSQWITRNLH